MNLVAACRDPFGEYLNFAENPVRCFWIHSFSLVSCLVSLQVPPKVAVATVCTVHKNASYEFLILGLAQSFPSFREIILRD